VAGFVGGLPPLQLVPPVEAEVGREDLEREELREDPEAQGRELRRPGEAIRVPPPPIRLSNGGMNRGPIQAGPSIGMPRGPDGMIEPPPGSRVQEEWPPADWMPGGPGRAQAQRPAPRVEPPMERAPEGYRPEGPAIRVGTVRPSRPRVNIPAQSRRGADEKARSDDGEIYCPSCGVKTTPGTRRTRGSKVAPTEKQYDHVVPWTRGGGNEPENIEVKCQACNNKKGNKDEATWNAQRHQK
jgi:5-methylcytosine-specific restriction endonuclease McrA